VVVYRKSVTFCSNPTDLEERLPSTKTVVKLSTPLSVCLPKPVVGGLDAGNTAGPPLFYKSKSKIWTQVQVKIV
jgi:hypothetical protein